MLTLGCPQEEADAATKDTHGVSFSPHPAFRDVNDITPLIPTLTVRLVLWEQDGQLRQGALALSDDSVPLPLDRVSLNRDTCRPSRASMKSCVSRCPYRKICYSAGMTTRLTG